MVITNNYLFHFRDMLISRRFNNKFIPSSSGIHYQLGFLKEALDTLLPKKALSALLITTSKISTAPTALIIFLRYPVLFCISSKRKEYQSEALNM